MPSPLEMSQVWSSYQAVMKPSRHIKKTLLDVFFTASAEVLVNNHHQLPERWVTKPPSDFIFNIQATLVEAHLQLKKKNAVLLRSA